MTIKQLGGVFGRNPEFNEVDVKKISIESSVQPSLEINNTGSDGDILSIEKNGSAVGSLGNFSTRLYIESDGDASGLLFGSGDVSPRKNGANVSDAVSLGNTTNKFKFLYLTRNVVVGNGYGIDFSATAGAGTSELLSDYEEGTFIPTYTTSGTDFDSVSYVVVYGNYVKIGTLVYATGFIRTSSITVGSASGTVRIGGLPFARTGSMSPPVYISGAEGWGGDVPIGGLVNTNQTITLQYRTAANTSYLNTAITDLATSGSNDIRFTAMYRVSY